MPTPFPLLPCSQTSPLDRSEIGLGYNRGRSNPSTPKPRSADDRSSAGSVLADGTWGLPVAYRPRAGVDRGVSRDDARRADRTRDRSSILLPRRDVRAGDLAVDSLQE